MPLEAEFERNDDDDDDADIVDGNGQSVSLLVI